jgi:hypothetical protein
MVATQQVGEKMTWGFSQGKADCGFGSYECQAAMTNAKSSSPRDATSNISLSPLWQLHLRDKIDQLPTSQPYQSRLL